MLGFYTSHRSTVLTWCSQLITALIQFHFKTINHNFISITEVTLSSLITLCLNQETWWHVHETTQSHITRLSLVNIHRNALLIRTIVAHTHTHTFSQTPSHFVFTFCVSNRATQADWKNASGPLAPSESSLMCAYIISTSSELNLVWVKSLLS